jgi:hypothetical protein
MRAIRSRVLTPQRAASVFPLWRKSWNVTPARPSCSTVSFHRTSLLMVPGAADRQIAAIHCCLDPACSVFDLPARLDGSRFVHLVWRGREPGRFVTERAQGLQLQPEQRRPDQQERRHAADHRDGPGCLGGL